MTATTFWQWLFGTDAGLLARIAAGGTILLILAAVDLLHKRRQATRWKEYLFLLACVAAAMAYGLANDMATVTISPVYFIVHGNLPVDTPNIRRVAAVLSVRGTWWVGAILGAVMLVANNPLKRWPRLGYRRMYAKLFYPFAAALLASVVLAAAAYSGRFDGLLNVEGQGALRDFHVVYWAHVGAYCGAAVGGLAALVAILGQRRKAARPQRPSTG